MTRLLDHIGRRTTRRPTIPVSHARRYPEHMTEPAEHRPQPAADEPLPNAPHATPEQRAKSRAWARRVLAHRPDPADDDAIRARLGLRARRGAA